MGIQYHSFIYLLIHQEFIESLATEEASGLGSPFKAESIQLRKNSRIDITFSFFIVFLWIRSKWRELEKGCLLNTLSKLMGCKILRMRLHDSFQLNLDILSMPNIPFKASCHLLHKFSLIFGAAAFAQYTTYMNIWKKISAPPTTTINHTNHFWKGPSKTMVSVKGWENLPHSRRTILSSVEGQGAGHGQEEQGRFSG